MRILAVRGGNLTSLDGPFAVDFNAEPLRRAGLFAITGPTGAGKSTILDALCLALFDQMPRLPKGRGEQSAAERDPKILSANDVRGVLRRGAASGWAEVDFVGVDGLFYRARWEVRRARLKASGALQAQSLSLTSLDGEQRFGDGKKAVLEEIETRLGLSFEQFRRAVLLAQGDFATFLKAPAPERSALLELLTGTEIYSTLSKAAHERERREREALTALTAQGGGIGVLDADSRAALETEVGDADAAVKAGEQALELARAAVAWHARDRQLAEAEQQATDAAARAESAWREAEPRRVEAALRSALQPLRPVIADADRAAREAAEAQAADQRARIALLEAQTALTNAAEQHNAASLRLEQATAEQKAAEPDLVRAADLDGQNAALVQESDAARRARDAATERLTAIHAAQRQAETALTDRRAQVAALESALAEQSGLAPLAAQWSRWDAALARHAEAARHCVEAEREAARHAKTLAGLTGQAENAALAVTEAESQNAQAETALATVLAEDAPALETTSQARKAASEQRERLRALASLAERAAQRREERTTACAEEAHRRNEAERETAAAATCAEEARIRQAARDEAEQTLRRLQLTQREDVETLRHRLVAGEACPVCGSEDHPWADHQAPLARLTHEQEERVAALNEAVAALLSQQAGHEATARAARTAADALAERLSALSREIAADAARWAEQAAAFALPAEPDGAAAAERLAEFDTRLATLADDETRALDHRRRLDEARAAQTRASQALVEKKAALQAVKERLDAAGTAQALALVRRDHAQADRDAALDEVAEPCAGQPNWRAAATADPHAFRAGLAARVAAYQNQRERLAVEQRAADEAALDLDRKRAERAGAETADAEARQRFDDVSTRLAARQTERAGLLDGQPVAERRAALAARAQEAGVAAQRAALARQDSAARLTAAEREVERCGAAAKNSAIQADSAATALSNAATACGVTVAEARSKLALPEVERLAEERALAELETARRDAALLANERQRQRADHHAQQRPETDAAEADAAANRLAESLTADRLRQGAARGRLTADDANRARLADLTVAIDAQKAQHGLWATLAGLIGSADGQKMRNFAQSLSLDMLLGHANRHLDDLARRYRLERVAGANLDIQVIDREMGDERRGVHSLSGGELFLVSLALALGLSAMAAGTAGGIGTLFIDEGFGSLDPDSLDVALSCLEALQAGGRQVGVISHVPAMVERIGAQIRVTPLGGGRSRVSVLSTGGAATEG